MVSDRELPVHASERGLETDEREPQLVASTVGALERAAVRYSFRKGPTSDEALPLGGEIDLQLDVSATAEGDEALRGAGFHRLEAPGHPGHLFYIGFAAGRWLKVDVKTANPSPGSRMGALVQRVVRAVGMRRPAALRRLGPVVAVLGPDGAGKGSVIAALQERIPMGVAVIYLGRRKRRRSKAAPSARPARKVSVPRETVFLVREVVRAWKRLLPAYVAAWRGHIALCDRHPIEVLAVRPERTRIGRHLERFLFGRLVPWPDRMVILDAPGEVLFERKGEHSAEVLDRWRAGYVEEFVPKGAVVVSALQPLEKVVRSASRVVWEELCARRRW